jgi:spore coat protein U-like protein
MRIAPISHSMKRIVLLFALLLVVMPARAQVCTASISSINFGSIAPATSSSANALGTVTVSCTPAALNPPVRVCINIGTGSGGTSFAPRLASSGTSTLQYNLYSNSAGSIVWGSRTSTSYPAVPIDLTFPLGQASVNATVTIYGSVAAGQTSLSAGTYLSTFSGVPQAEMTYAAYVLLPPDCSTVTTNSTPLSFSVAATVINDCSISATNINFGTAGVLNGTLSATGTLSVACTNNDAYSIALSAGTGNGASVADRRMTRAGGSEQVRYQLFQNAAFSTPWGDGTGGTAPVGGIGNGVNQAITVYARVLPQATPSAGNYADTITATITY